MSTFLSLAVFSGIFLNLIFQFALGLQAAAAEEALPLPRIQTGIIFLSVLLVWIIFFYILTPLGLGFLEYFLLFPLSALACFALETLVSRLFPAARSFPRLYNALSAYDGLVLAAAFITLHTAVTFTDAVALSLGFSLGVLLSLLLINKIRARSTLENVPAFLRGSPLAFISLGLLSLIASVIATVLFRSLWVF